MKVFFVALFLLVSNMVTHAESILIKDPIKPYTSIVYKTLDKTKLSLHIFNPEGHQVTDQVPVIVFFFGGGWTSGTPKQFYEQSLFFTQKGIVAISAEYRVKNKHDTTPFDAVNTTGGNLNYTVYRNRLIITGTFTASVSGSQLIASLPLGARVSVTREGAYLRNGVNNNGNMSYLVRR